MTISFDRSICCDLHETSSREWLVTNGLGGYAAGTVAGVLTRLQHGLLVAMSPYAETPQLLLAKIDEEVFFDERTYYLGTNEYPDGVFSPAGFVHLESFRIEEGLPIFTYRLGGADGIILEKRIWMAQGYNTTYIQYRILRTTTTDEAGHRRSGITGAISADITKQAVIDKRLLSPMPHCLTLTLLPFVAYRPYNQPQCGNNDQHFQIQVHEAAEQNSAATCSSAWHLPPGAVGCTIQAHDHALPYHILALSHSEQRATFIPTGVWYWHFVHQQHTVEGHPVTSDLYLPGVIRATLPVDEDSTLTVAVSAEPLAAQLRQIEPVSFSAGSESLSGVSAAQGSTSPETTSDALHGWSLGYV